MDTLEKLISALQQNEKDLFEKLPPAASEKQIIDAEKELNVTLPEDLKNLYRKFNGFPIDGYFSFQIRLLPLGDVVNSTKKISGNFIPTDLLSGKGMVVNAKKTDVIIIATYSPDNLDSEWIGLKISSNKKTGKIWIMYKSGGIHSFAELVDSGENLNEWIEECLEAY